MILNLFLGFLVYWPIFFSFFFMDDFYFLQISQANNFKEFINFFKPIKFIPFRPISQQLFFFSFQKLFGLNPLPFHVFIFLLHVFNSLFVYKISLKFLKKSIKAKLISLMYLVSSLHFVGLYSITGSYVLFGVFFFLLGFWLWFKFEKEKKNYFYFLSFLAFVLGVFSSEIAASLPFVILLVSKFQNRLIRLFPYGAIILLNLFINFCFAGAPKTEAFQFKLMTFPSLLRWYILRAFGLPEGVRNGYLWEKLIIYPCFILLLLIVLASIVLKRRLLWKKRKGIIKYFLWIIISALPFYFMPNHLNPIYFSLSFFGFLLLLEKILTQKLFFVYSIIFIILSFFGVRLLLHTHWTVRRSKLAKYWIEKVRTYSSLKNNAVVLSIPDFPTKEELRITLQDNRALQLFFHNDNLKTIYQIK